MENTSAISTVRVSRRRLMKAGVAASAASIAGIPITSEAAGAAREAEAGITWTKGVCRFCGTGCGLLVGTKNGRIVATKGDPDCEVNRGLTCLKGYYNSEIMYGKDRLTRPLMRRTNGKFDKNGKFEPVSWKEALDEMEKHWRAAYQELGPTGVGIFGSGQYTIPEGVAVVKLLKAGFRSNNIDPNARLCMASAVVGMYQVFGVDEPSAGYHDFERTQNIVLWGNNPAEAHPVLWSRIIAAKRTIPGYRIINLQTHPTLSSRNADVDIIFKPNSDLAIANYILREIVHRGCYDKDFIDRHCIFATGPSDIGYGMRPTDKFAYPAEKDTQAKQVKKVLSEAEAVGQRRRPGEAVEQKHAGGPAGSHWHITFEDFKKGVEPYTLEYTVRVAKGDPDESADSFAKKLKMLADIYCDKASRVISTGCMGTNQHQRGTWINESLYSIHLLMNKQAKPGNSMFSLTGQPSACGTCREVGTFSHRLPSDLLVANPKHRAKCEKIWGLPEGTLNGVVGYDAMKLLRGLEDGTVRFLWTQVVNIFQSTPNSTHWLRAARKPENFIVVADAYPTFSATQAADLILPASMIFEKWGVYGNGERRTNGWPEMVKAPGEARTDVWMMLEFAKRFKIKECWKEQKLPGGKTLPNVLDRARAMGIDPEASLYDVIFGNKFLRSFKWPDPKWKGRACGTAEVLGDGWFPEKALYEEYWQFTQGEHQICHFDESILGHGIVWPYIDGKSISYRFNGKYDPFCKGADFAFYGPLMKAIPSGNLDGVTDKTPKPLPNRAKIFFRPYADPVEMPDEKYDLWFDTGRLMEHWHTGTMTTRVPELLKAVPEARLYMNPADAKKRGIADGDRVKVTSRRATIYARACLGGRMPVQKGITWGAFFDQNVQFNQLCLDATCPLSLEPDYKKCAIRVEKA
ncbi:nitrate reductase catalytic subunit NapA [Mesosutterella sp. AGMB02718]|uniref:Nitrate reductase catalytic subunit NapA n=1 Tax=Mesosutterella faecium TaxID=2925194 RepID=A0ABT7IM33_9BURK|nr:nitrate reductase catalytic subunit NapA [Mesosutterella sp. AGMB02718]MDL2059426.1 nitrate reductase catalytic subunit NapA [Mesosutterella sp. AGMB02718]